MQQNNSKKPLTNWDEFHNIFKCKSIDELKEYAQDVVSPSNDYYESLFNDRDGDCYAFKRAILAAQVFDPFFLKDASNGAIKLLVDELKFFGYELFQSDDFINGMKDEIQAVKEEAGKDFDWDDVGNSSQYQYKACKEEGTEWYTN